jgi:hypothetical protein
MPVGAEWQFSATSYCNNTCLLHAAILQSVLHGSIAVQRNGRPHARVIER